MSGPNVAPAKDPMRLGFVTGRMGFLEGNTLWTDAGLGRLIDALAARASTLTVAISIADKRRPAQDHRRPPGEARLRPIGPRHVPPWSAAFTSRG